MEYDANSRRLGPRFGDFAGQSEDKHTSQSPGWRNPSRTDSSKVRSLKIALAVLDPEESGAHVELQATFGAGTWDTLFDEAVASIPPGREGDVS